MNQGTQSPAENTPFVPGEGMLHGPHAVPEEGGSDQWLLKEAGGDPELFQLLKLRETVIDDLAEHAGDPELLQANKTRLHNETEQRKPVAPETVRARIDEARGGRRPTYKKRHK